MNFTDEDFDALTELENKNTELVPVTASSDEDYLFSDIFENMLEQFDEDEDTSVLIITIPYEMSGIIFDLEDLDYSTFTAQYVRTIGDASGPKELIFNEETGEVEYNIKIILSKTQIALFNVDDMIMEMNGEL